MNTLRNAGTFTLLTEPEDLIRQLPVIELAGRTCYQSYEGKEITLESAAAFCRMLIDRPHDSVLEHSHMTVRFEKLSRGFTHEMVRMRLCAFSQESTRYVDYKLEKHEASAVAPPDSSDAFDKAFDAAFAAYVDLRNQKVPSEDARQVLPTGLVSEIVVTANFREWRHIFELRCDKPAHWEIRGVMVALLQHLQGFLPGLFEDFLRAGTCKKGISYYKKLLPLHVLDEQIALRVQHGLSLPASVETGLSNISGNDRRILVHNPSSKAIQEARMQLIDAGYRPVVLLCVDTPDSTAFDRMLQTDPTAWTWYDRGITGFQGTKEQFMGLQVYRAKVGPDPGIFVAPDPEVLVIIGVTSGDERKKA
jgi:thymidylate synthase (FAD)